MPIGADFRGYGNVDNPTAILLQRGSQRLGEGEGADEIHVERLLDVVNLSVKAVDTHVAWYSRIVHEERQIGVIFVQLFRCLLDAGKVSQFYVHPSQYVDTSLLKFPDGFLGAFLVACANDYFPSAQAQMLGNSESDAFVGSCYKYNFFFHLLFSCWFCGAKLIINS